MADEGVCKVCGHQESEHRDYAVKLNTGLSIQYGEETCCTWKNELTGYRCICSGFTSQQVKNRSSERPT